MRAPGMQARIISLRRFVHFAQWSSMTLSALATIASVFFNSVSRFVERQAYPLTGGTCRAIILAVFGKNEVLRMRKVENQRKTSCG